MIARTDHKLQAFDLLMAVGALIREGKRDPRQVTQVLRGIKEHPDYLTRLFSVQTPTFLVWRVLSIGSKSKDELLVALKAGDMLIAECVADLMDKEGFTTIPESMILNLVRCKVKDLGFTWNPTTQRIFSRIREIGGEPCPAEVGPHLRLTFRDQSKGDMCWIVMEPIADSNARPSVFYIGRERTDENPWIYVCGAGPDDEWHLERSVVFVLPS